MKNLPIIFMYSGQGSHYYQMGKYLFEQNKIFRHYMQYADKKFIELTGTSVLKNLYDPIKPKSEAFLDLALTHPAIFMVEYALTQVLLENNIYPDFTLGASMGEFAAAVCSHALDFETALQAINVQAKAVIKNSITKGGMLAILTDPHLYQKEAYLFEHSQLAAVNFSTHFVISGKLEELTRITKLLKEKDIASQLLPVSYGFHSTLIDAAETDFLENLSIANSLPMLIPLISCTNVTLLTSLTKQHLWDVIRKPILFQATIEYLEAKQPALYIDVGPSGTLGTFIKYNLGTHSLSKYISLLTPFSEDLNKLTAALKFIKNGGNDDS